MKKKHEPLTLLRTNRLQAIDRTNAAVEKRVRSMLERAQRSLNERIRQVEGLRGPGSDSFTAAQLRTTLAQIKHVLGELNPQMKLEVLNAGKLSAEESVSATLAYINRADQRFTGIAQRLPINEAKIMDRALQGTNSSVLRRLIGDSKAGPGILKRYGENVIERFETRLQTRFLAKTPWADVRNEIVADSEFLQQAPAHWAERIVRNEVMNAHNRAQFESMRVINKDVGGGMLKILSATFDDRTSADSYAVHGQIRRVGEAFQDWNHMYQHPPNRPNDREVVVPHNMDWPLPEALAWRSDSEVSARWRQEGRKGSPPSRPNMTTVPLDKIGKSA